MSHRAGDDPAGDVRRHEDLYSLDFFALTNLKSLIQLAWRDDAEYWVGSGDPGWAGRKVLENKRLGGDDEHLSPVSTKVDEESYDQKGSKHSEGDEERSVARHVQKREAHLTVGVSGEHSEAVRVHCTPG